MPNTSEIRALYSALAAKSVTFTKENGASVTVTAKDLHQLPTTPEPPVRLILGYSTFTEQRAGVFATLGPTAALTMPTWVIVDLLLWQRSTMGTLSEAMPDLTRYQGAYIDMLRTFRSFGATNAGTTLDGWRLIPGTYDWPIGSQNPSGFWHGVMCAMTVSERLSG